MSSLSGPEHFASRRALNPIAAERMEHCAFLYGETYDAYLVTESDREYFFSTGRRGVVGFKRWGRNLQVIGGLLADPADQEQLLLELLAFARRRRWRVTFFGIGRSDFKLFRQHGFQITKLGEEPIVLLDETEWKGQAYEWLRRQEKACLKSGVTFREIDPAVEGAAYAEQIAPQLEEISREHVAGTIHRREMKFFVGQFEPFTLGRRRLFVAETKDRIECFLVLNPCLGGTMWAIEIFRKRADAPRGIIPFAMLQAMRQLQMEEVPYVSLSLIPWLRSSVRLAGDSLLMRYASHFLWTCGSALYDVRGMYHFKSRFRPHWRELYIASKPGIGISTIAAVGMTWGLLKVNPLRVIAHWWRDRADKSRQSLAEPPWRPERVIRSLRNSEETESAAPPALQASAPVVQILPQIAPAETVAVGP
jgi:phosphatidylglycerol lysyltransferase